MIYHVCRRAEWHRAESAGIYTGSTQDQADGFILFSAADQLVDSVAKHRGGQDGLVLLACDERLLGDHLRWDVSRNGALFPHLYAPLPLTAIVSVQDLPLGTDGRHLFPPFM